MIITQSQQQQAPLSGGGTLSISGAAPFVPRNGLSSTMPSIPSATGAINPATGTAELTGDSLWDSLYNTTIRTLSLDGLELLAKSFDNLDPNHQLYAGIAKRQRKLMEYQSEFRRNLEVFCQRANLNPKQWPTCIKHVKPVHRDSPHSPGSANTSAIDGLLNWTASKEKKPATNDQSEKAPTPMTPLPQQPSPSANSCEEKKENALTDPETEKQTEEEQKGEVNNDSGDEKTPEWA